MRSLRTIALVGCHAEGEVGDVIIGGVRDVPGKTMYEKLEAYRETQDSLRPMLMNEPRGRPSLNTNILMPPCSPKADMGLLIMANDEYAYMSGSNLICASTVILETGMVPMQEPETELTWDTAAGLISVTACCAAGKCQSVTFTNVAAFVAALDLTVSVPGLGDIAVDIAWGGMWYAFVDAASLGLALENKQCPKLVDAGMRIKRAVRQKFSPVHPDNPDMTDVAAVSITEPLQAVAGERIAKHSVIISPGRCDRSPCGTGTSARMAILHARGQLKVGETFRHRSIIDTEFVCSIKETTTVGEYDAIIPTISGRGWITSYKQVVLDPTDPYPEGFRVGDIWPMSNEGGE